MIRVRDIYVISHLEEIPSCFNVFFLLMAHICLSLVRVLLGVGGLGVGLGLGLGLVLGLGFGLGLGLG